MSKWNSVKNKIFFTVIPIIIILLIVLLGAWYVTGWKTLKNTGFDTMKQITERTERLLNQKAKNQIKILSTLVKQYEYKDDEVPWENLRKRLEEDKDFIEATKLGISDLEGNTYYNDDGHENLFMNENFKKSLDGKVIISEVEYSEKYKQEICYYFIPIKEGEKVEKILVAIIDGEKIRNYLKSVSNIEFGNINILYKDSCVLDFQEEKILTKEECGEKFGGISEFNRIYNEIIKSKSGNLEYNLNGVSKYMFYQKIGNFDEYLIIYIDESTLFKSLDEFKVITVASAIIFIILICIAISILGIFITKTINMVKAHIEGIGKGDFTKELNGKLAKKTDELGDIAKGMIKSQNAVQKLLLQVKDVTEEVKGQSAEIDEISEYLVDLSESFNEVIMASKKKSIDQVNKLQGIINDLDNFNKMIEQSKDNIKDISVIANEINKKSRERNRDMSDLSDSIEVFNNKFNRFTSSISDMNVSIKAVDSIVDTINNIAEQTNLLALNATIEATRAGKYGSGFSVVAKEISALAEESKISAKNIQAITSRILKDTNTIVTSSDNMTQELKTQNETVNEAILSFREISLSVNEIKPRVEKASKGLVNIFLYRDKFSNSVKSVANKAKEIDEVASKASGYSETLKSYSNSANKEEKILQEKIEKLIRNMNRFKI